MDMSKSLDLKVGTRGLGSFADSGMILFDGIVEGIQIWDREGRLLYANPATRRHFGDLVDPTGQSYANLIGRCVDDNGLPILSHQFPIAQVQETGQPVTGVVFQIVGRERVWLELNAYPIVIAAVPEAAILSTSHEVSGLVEKSRRLELHAHHDALTGLPNRSTLKDRLNVAIAHSKRRSEMLAICMLDLDGFKPVNDTLGHEAGDALLKEIARRLVETLRTEDTAIRLGGDEFVLLIGGLKKESECELALKRVLETVARPMAIRDHPVQVTASIGVTIFPNDPAVEDQLLRHADQAMYKAKEQGKNGFRLFDPTLESRRQANRNAKDRIAKALKEGQLELYYQPQVDCSQGRVIGAEALIRWNHPVLGLRAPAEFLPLIEQDDLIVDLGNWVLEAAARQLEAWRVEGLELHLGVNISARQLLRGAFDARLDDLLRRYAPEVTRCLEIEVLETAALEDMKAVGRMIADYKARGISFALDDFGTGFSSLAHLKHLAVNTLKIDQSFVRDMLCDPGDMAIVQGVLGLSQAFRGRAVAEGVESIDQILRLIGMGCPVMQGYGIARPMPAFRLPGWIKDFHENPLWSAARDRYPSRQDFEMLLMEVTQRHWFEQARRIAEAPRGSGGAEPPISYEESRIARWYRGDGARAYGDLPEFHELDVLNRNVHRLAVELFAAKGNVPPGGENPLVTELAMANEKLVAALHRFRCTFACEGVK